MDAYVCLGPSQTRVYLGVRLTRLLRPPPLPPSADQLDDGPPPARRSVALSYLAILLATRRHGPVPGPDPDPANPGPDALRAAAGAVVRGLASASPPERRFCAWAIDFAVAPAGFAGGGKSADGVADGATDGVTDGVTDSVTDLVAGDLDASLVAAIVRRQAADHEDLGPDGPGPDRTVDDVFAPGDVLAATAAAARGGRGDAMYGSGPGSAAAGFSNSGVRAWEALFRLGGPARLPGELAAALAAAAAAGGEVGGGERLALLEALAGGARAARGWPAAAAAAAEAGWYPGARRLAAGSPAEAAPGWAECAARAVGGGGGRLCAWPWRVAGELAGPVPAAWPMVSLIPPESFESTLLVSA
jgi:hypothetical protein